jgi:hypothetical protein
MRRIADRFATEVPRRRRARAFGHHTELIDFDVAHIGLPYNAILGYPALAKFMVAVHHGYNVLKIPGCSGIITIACEEKDAAYTLKRAYKAAAVEHSDDEGGAGPREAVPPKKRQLLPIPDHIKAKEMAPATDTPRPTSTASARPPLA